MRVWFDFRREYIKPNELIIRQIIVIFKYSRYHLSENAKIIANLIPGEESLKLQDKSVLAVGNFLKGIKLKLFLETTNL